MVFAYERISDEVVPELVVAGVGGEGAEAQLQREHHLQHACIESRGQVTDAEYLVTPNGI